MRSSKMLALVLLPLVLFAGRGNAYNMGFAGQDGCFQTCDNWYGLVGAGYAFSRKAGIDVGSDWDPSDQGYDAKFTNSPFFFIGFGRTFCSWIDFDVTYSYYQPLHYQKYQTTTAPATPPPGFAGPARTRFFDLDHQNLMFDLTLDTTSWFCFGDCWGLNIRPIVGGGIGVGINTVSNFHTVGFEGDGGTTVGSTTSIGDPRRTTAFAWQVLAALRFGVCNCCPFSFDIGYRYYNGGRFNGPTSVVSNTATFAGSQIPVSAWKGKFKANEVYFALNYGF